MGVVRMLGVVFWAFCLPVVSAAPAVIISEFIAANSGTATNSLGETADWIELYNTTSVTVDLAGWYLTDSEAALQKWRFPPVSLSPRSYRLIWASGADRVIGTEIHTSFRLSADGEYLALVRPDGVTVEHDHAPQFPRQVSDVSYGLGLLDNGTDARWGDHRRDVLPRNAPNEFYTPNTHYYPEQSRLLNQYFPARTANVIQQYKAAGLYPSLNAPEFGRHGGSFTGAISVTLSGPATIFYTLDGSDPREYGTGAIRGTPYGPPISLTHSTRVKSRSSNGSEWSALTEADFLDLSPSPLRISEVMYAPRLPVGTELAASSNPMA